MADPWIVQPHEHIKFAEHFRNLNPINGMVTGEQAKKFMLQSQLPPPVLGQIWFLADTDADGKLDLKEFSIACKIINLKLHGIEIPKTLPGSLISSLTPMAVPAKTVPILTPPQKPAIPPLPVQKSQPGSNLDDLIGASQPLVACLTSPPNQKQSVIGASTVISPQSAQPTLVSGGGAVPFVPPNSVAPMITSVEPIVKPLIPPTMTAAPLIGGFSQPITSQPIAAPGVAGSLPTGVTVSQPVLGQSTLVNSPPKLDMIGQPVTSTPIPVAIQKSTVEADVLKSGVLSPSSDQPMSPIEWAIPSAQKNKYTQLFNATDRNKVGWVSGVQARAIMLQSRLPQQTLAQIWALADLDSDGKLGCEEFVLAMYLCEIATQGEIIPAKLPTEMIPPAFRRDSMTSSSSYEEKRRENFARGQAELDRRRSILAETQAKEKAERERKEREEAEKREKARLEALRKEQEELERKRKEEQEKRDAARKEMERQCQLEWEKKRTREMETMRSEEQSKVLALKAKVQRLTSDQSTITLKASNLAKDIRETRTNVAQIKASIDGMRCSRDSSMSEMQQLKARVKELNTKQIALNQEKAHLDSKMNADGGDDGKMNMMEMTLKQLKDKVEAAKAIVETKRADVDTSKSQLSELTQKVDRLVQKCDRVWQMYEEQKQLYGERMTAPAAAEDSWPVAKEADWAVESTQAWGTGGAAGTAEADWPSEPASWTGESTPRYRCLFEFLARTVDELSLQPGDLISDATPNRTDAEPGWRWGLCRGKKGWYPESYVEEINPTSSSTYNSAEESIETSGPATKTQLEGIAEVPETLSEAGAAEPLQTAATGDFWIAAYPYSSGEPGDLVFDAGEAIEVISKNGDWWTGRIGGVRTGIFPSNYVTRAEHETSAATSVTSTVSASTVVDAESLQAEPKSTTPINTEVASITDAASVASGNNDTRPSSVVRRDSGRDSVTGLPRKAKEVAQALANYVAKGPEQLSLSKGQLLVVRKKADTGWWEGELQAKGRNKQIGWFPASYVKVLTSSGRMSGRTTPVLTNKMDSAAEHVIDKVIALYSYVAQNADELSFEKDDIISVLDREQDPAWWQGELRGTTGLFPSNYVAKLVHDN